MRRTHFGLLLTLSVTKAKERSKQLGVRVFLIRIMPWREKEKKRKETREDAVEISNLNSWERTTCGSALWMIRAVHCILHNNKAECVYMRKEQKPQLAMRNPIGQDTQKAPLRNHPKKVSSFRSRSPRSSNLLTGQSEAKGIFRAVYFFVKFANALPTSTHKN